MTSSRTAPQRIQPLLLVLLASLAGCEGGGPSIGPSVDSNSNWLIECHTHSDCPSGTGVCMTGICLQPQVFAANPDDQRCVDACEERVHDHLLEPCLASGEPEDLCSAHASELVAHCRADCSALDAAYGAPNVTGTFRDPGEPPAVGDEGQGSDGSGSDVPDDTVLNDCETGALTGARACDFYEGSLCSDGTPFIQTYGISREAALENCRLNDTLTREEGGVEGGVVCTWNGEVVYESCEDSPGVRSPEACEGWEVAAFDRADEFIDTRARDSERMHCSSGSYSRFDARYGLWVGLVSCGAGYRFYLSETAEGPYLPAADGGGHGQDLCELVDPSFSIPIDGDITSGGCTTCTISTNYSFVAGEVFGRTAFGEPFRRVEAPTWGNYQSAVIQCASGPVECGLPTSLVDCELDPLGCR